MAGSGAGLNRSQSVILPACAAATSAVYDSLVFGDTRYPLGPKMWEAAGFTKWGFQIITSEATISGWSVAIFGTFDMRAYWMMQSPSGLPPGFVLPASSWFELPSPETETTDDVFDWHNPLTGLNQGLYCSAPLVAVRAIATATSATGDITVIGFAVP